MEEPLNAPVLTGCGIVNMKWKAAEDGTLYLTPTKTAQPSIYDPLAEYQKIVLDAINIGRWV